VLPDRLPAQIPRAAVAVKRHHTSAAAELLRGLSPSLDHVGILGTDVAITARAFAAVTGQTAAGPTAHCHRAAGPGPIQRSSW
jgi:Asp-tRNA(Asn)/Glu-tRNA(Gln) amidotransferase A subunit family amidase